MAQKTEEELVRVERAVAAFPNGASLRQVVESPGIGLPDTQFNGAFRG